jgi:hypothetical protein
MTTLYAFAGRTLAAAAMVTVLAGGTPAPQATAQPPGFPDLNSFAPVPADGYITKKSKGSSDLSTIDFSTPYNVGCLISASQDPNTAPSQYTMCDGDLPGLDNLPLGSAVIGLPDGSSPRPGDCVQGQADPQGMGPGYKLNRFFQACDGPVTGHRGKPLGAGQKITFKNVTCAVGANRVIACLDTTSGEHGFLLQPSGSTAF